MLCLQGKDIEILILLGKADKSYICMYVRVFILKDQSMQRISNKYCKQVLSSSKWQ